MSMNTAISLLSAIGYSSGLIAKLRGRFPAPKKKAVSKTAIRSKAQASKRPARPKSPAPKPRAPPRSTSPKPIAPKHSMEDVAPPKASRPRSRAGDGREQKPKRGRRVPVGGQSPYM